MSFTKTSDKKAEGAAKTEPKVKKIKGAEKTPVFQVPKGMHDALPADQPWWNRTRRAVEEMAAMYNFLRIDTPILESAELFQRSIGEETDLVQKEMYTLKTKGGDVLALRPEGTAPLVRAYLQHGMSRLGQPLRLYYEGPFFRHERPQAGRYRQLTQAGFEIIGGPNDPIFDAQVILVFDRLLKYVKIGDVVLKINSIGCRICRPFYKRQLQTYYKRHEQKLCADCQRRLNANVLRLLDCKNENCKPFKEHAPNFLDKLCSACSQHFKGVLEYLDELGISYSLDNQLVRGLDYYNRTVFEMMVQQGPGAELGALLGGGRYDYLFEELGGRLTPAVGGAVGYERLIEAMKAQKVNLPAKNQKRVFVIYVGELAKRKALKLTEQLRSAGLAVTEAFGKESLRAQLKIADKEGFSLALILGQKEIYEESVILRDLRNSLQENISMSKMVDEIKKRLKEK